MSFYLFPFSLQADLILTRPALFWPVVLPANPGGAFFILYPTLQPLFYVRAPHCNYPHAKPTPQSSRNFSTSARAFFPSDDLSKARQPKSPEVKGDQNPHLKHSSPESKDAGKGNAAPEPHLPSKSKQTSSGSAATGEGRKMFSTSARVGADKEGKAGKAGTYEGEAGKAGYVSV